MARIAGINIPVNKHVVISLTHIHGIGRTRALDACRAAVHDALRGEFTHLALDVIFTHDPRWVAASVGNDMVSSGG